MSSPKYCIMFPNNSTAVMMGQSLTADLGHVAYFIPDGTHEQAAFTCYQEVMLASMGLENVTVTRVSDYNKMTEYQYIIFPCLDVNHRKSRAEFGTMCSNLFKYV